MVYSLKLILTSFTLFLCIAHEAHSAFIVGGEGNDTIIGTSVDDMIDGRAGDDAIYGNGGNDSILSGAGNDTVYGGEGNDTITGNEIAGDGSDVLYGESGNDVLNGVDDGYAYGGPGNDTFNNTNRFSYGGPGDDTFTVGPVWGTLSGEDGNDTIVASTVSWSYWFSDPIPNPKNKPGQLLGGNGDDEVTVSQGFCIPVNDVLIDGGLGIDALTITSGFVHPSPPVGCHDLVLNTRNFEKFTILGGVDWINGPRGSSALIDEVIPAGSVFAIDIAPSNEGYWSPPVAKIDASAESDSRIVFRSSSPPAEILGGKLDDAFFAASRLGNNDIFTGGPGNDFFDGGNGVDTAKFSGSRSDYTISEVTYNTLEIRDNRDGSPDGTDTVIDVNKLEFVDQVTDVVIKGLYLVGDEGNDDLCGTSGADLIDGKGGNDDLCGGGGNDTIIGGNGEDTIDGGTGADIINGGDGTDTIGYGVSDSGVTASLDDPTGNTGDAVGDSYASVENISGSSSNDNLSGDEGSNVVEGGNGSDSLSGGDGNDTMYGDAITVNSAVLKLTARQVLMAVSPGDDVLMGGKGNDAINGGDGSDTAVYVGSFADYTVSYSSSLRRFTVTDKVGARDGTDTVTGVEYFQFADGTQLATNLMTNKINGTEGADKLAGSIDDDELRGFGGNDNMTGNAGNDLLDGGSGADSMSGGDGDDSYIVDDPKDKVKETARPESGIDTVYTSLSSYTLPSNVENLVYTGAGNFSGKGNKLLNQVSGGPDDDILDGKQGGDSMTGKGGNDSYYVDSPADLVNEDFDGGVFDQVISVVTVTSLAGNVEGLTLSKGNINGRGNGLDNFILGSSGLNILEGGDGVDTLIGGLGNDSFYGETTSSVGDDADTIAYTGAKKAIVFSLSNTLAGQNTGGAGTDRIYDNSSIENLTGSAFNDTLTGNLGPNVISGADGNDTVIGLAGADVLVGGIGLDLIDCGADAEVDRVVYALMTDSPPGAALRDQVSNFISGADVIDLSLIDANATEAGDQAFQWGGTSAAAHSVWYTVTGSDILVSADVSGDTIPEFELLLKGTGAVQQVDFVY